MKVFPALSAICVSFLCGCAEMRVTDLPPVGPQAVAKSGYLVVNSATTEYNSGDVWYYPHTEYELYSASGRFLRTVRNHLGNQDETAEVVTLAPGNYSVIADSEDQGRVRVPVRVADGRSTVVNLQAQRLSSLAK